MDRQFYSNSSRKICFALLIGVFLMLGSVSVLKQFIVHESGARLNSMPFYSAKDHLKSVKVSYSLHKLQSHPLSIITNRAAEFPPAPAPAQTSVDSNGCERECGIVHIPYPFGLLPKCARSSEYQLQCIQSNSTIAQQNLQDPAGPWPFLSTLHGSSFQVTNISSSGYLIINATKIKAMPTTPSQGGSCNDFGNASLVLDPNGSYMISSANIFFVSGCRSVGGYSLNEPLQSFDVNSGGGICGPLSCVNQYEYPFCNFYDCCTLSLKSSKQIYMMAQGIAFAGQNNACGFCSIVYPQSYYTWNAALVGVGQYGVQLVWALHDYDNCSVAQSQPDYACTPNPASCRDVGGVPGYVCECTVPGYQGDGYKNGSGCSDIDECADASLNNCTEKATCTNYAGSYNCSCKNGYQGDGDKNGSGCSDIDECANASLNNCAEKATCTNYAGSYNCSCKNGLKGDGYRNGTSCTHSKSHVALIAGISSGVGVFLIINVMVSWCLRKRWQNGSYEFQPSDVSFHKVLMEIQKQDGANVCRLFSLKELKGATKNFSMENELGRGGLGAVFRGVLVDGTIVAIKKPKNDVGSSHDDIKQFINEVTILSQVNHRNLVRLLGCCLETRIPLLVYEYISNGNLFDCLHPKAKNKDKYFAVLHWGKRMEIAVGTAEALNYLHFGTSPPIYHRDVKTSNILLDDKYHSKVADFGLSRFVPIEATHVSTMLQGTPGYLDPEFFDNFQISDKSDVYSFGVVLIELITAKKPVDLSRDPGDQNLVIRFSGLMKEARLEDIIDVALDASSDPDMLRAIYKVAEVALKCVQRFRKHRPSMKEVLDELDLIKKSYKGSTSTTSFESLDQEWVPFNVGMFDSSIDYGFGSSHGSNFPRYGSSSSYANASGSGSGIELLQK